MTVHRFPTFDRDDFGPEYRPNLVDQLAAEWEQADIGRHSPLSPLRGRAASHLAGFRFNRGRIVKAFCLAIVVFNIVYFGGQLLRVFL